MKKGRQLPARRNPLATVVRKLRVKAKPSGKIYQRKAKHQNRRPPDGGFDVVGCTAAR